jgi:transketolase
MDNARLPILHGPSYRFQPGRVDVLREGTDITLFCMGSLTHLAAAAGEELAQEGIQAEVVNVPSIRPVDGDAIALSARKTGKVITVEEHSVHGGLGSLVCELIAERGIPAAAARIGFPEGHFPKAGPRADIRRHYGLDTPGIVRRAREMLRGGPLIR